MDFDAPIPGESLTKAPGSMPYERPPEINDPEEAIQMHLSRLSESDKQQDILDMLELDMDVVTLTEGILRSAVATGIHSIDVSMIIAPVIHEFIKTTAEDAGIDFDEGLVDAKKEKARAQAITKAKAAKMVRKFREEEGQTTEEAVVPQDDAPVEGPVDDAEGGFFSRREGIQ